MIKLVLGAYIALFVVMAALDVGKPMSSGTFQWYLPFLIFFVVATPALLGYLAGRDDGRNW